MATMTEFEKIEKEMQVMGDRLTLTHLLVTSMELIETLPEDQRDQAWQAIFMLIEGAKSSGVPIAEG
tara:strand:- start:341 stop:541 length:201 start_codon:yes stop_codon:yes gene_type:complete